MPGVKVNHTEWQEQVVDLARYTGWAHLHVRRTKGKGGHWTTSTNRTGWPDLFLWRPVRGGYAAIELKVKPDLPTVEQLQVLTELAAAGNTAVCVAYPDDFDRLRALLTGPAGAGGWTYEGPTRPS